MTTMAGRWMLFDLECVEPGHRWDGGNGDEPEWEWFEGFSTIPIEVLAERFTGPFYVTGHPGLDAYQREVRRRWFGLTEHEWECTEPEGSCDLDDWQCVNCDITQERSLNYQPPPWDEHCRPDVVA